MIYMHQGLRIPTNVYWSPTQFTITKLARGYLFETSFTLKKKHSNMSFVFCERVQFAFINRSITKVHRDLSAPPSISTDGNMTP